MTLQSQWFDVRANQLPVAGRPHVSAAYLQLLGGFDLVVAGESAPVGLSCQRLLRLLAVGGQQSRDQAAGILWPDVSTSRAKANLRSMVWRFQRSYPQVLWASAATIRLMSEVVVDIQQWAATAQRLMNLAEPMEHDELASAVAWCVKTELVPELGGDEWLAVERERYLQLGLHALEALSARLVRIGWFGAAVDVALASIRMDPLRESAHRALVEAYIAEGNLSDAGRQYERYRVLLGQELGVPPSPLFEELLERTGFGRSVAMRVQQRAGSLVRS